MKELQGEGVERRKETTLWNNIGDGYVLDGRKLGVE